MTETALGRRRLGRGLEALLGPTREEAEREGSLVELPVREIHPNPFQPRQDVDAASLEEIGEHTSELQSRSDLVCRLLLEKKKKQNAELTPISGSTRVPAC